MFACEGTENWAFPDTVGESVNIYRSFQEGNLATCTKSLKNHAHCSPSDLIIMCPCMPRKLSWVCVCVYQIYVYLIIGITSNLGSDYIIFNLFFFLPKHRMLTYSHATEDSITTVAFNFSIFFLVFPAVRNAFYIMTSHKHTCIFKKSHETILALLVHNALLILSVLLVKKLAMAHKNWFCDSLMICDPQFENYFFTT